jgi:hypothetical protein
MANVLFLHIHRQALQNDLSAGGPTITRGAFPVCSAPGASAAAHAAVAWRAVALPITVVISSARVSAGRRVSSVAVGSGVRGVSDLPSAPGLLFHRSGPSGWLRRGVGTRGAIFFHASTVSTSSKLVVCFLHSIYIPCGGERRDEGE